MKAPDEPHKAVGHMSRSRHKKMSDTGMYVSQTSVDTSEEEALECARKDLIKLMNLQVNTVNTARQSTAQLLLVGYFQEVEYCDFYEREIIFLLKENLLSCTD